MSTVSSELAEATPERGLPGAMAEAERSGRLARLGGFRSPKIIAGLVILVIFAAAAVFGPMIDHTDPSALSPDALQGPSAAHWLGTTQTGQDILAQVLQGGRVSLLVGFAAAAIATVLSLLVGLSAGYLGGLSDEVLSALSNIFLVIPALPLVIVLAGYLPSKGSFGVTIVIAVTGWAWGARVLRAQTLSIRKRDYIEAARATGERTFRVIFAEILPNELAIVASGFLFTVIFAILTQAGLAFLGLSSVSTWSWGTILYWAQTNEALQVGAWWWFLPPGLCIAFVGMGLALINFGIDEFVNPRLRTARIATKQAGKKLRSTTVPTSPSRPGPGDAPAPRRGPAPGGRKSVDRASHGDEGQTGEPSQSARTTGHGKGTTGHGNSTAGQGGAEAGRAKGERGPHFTPVAGSALGAGIAEHRPAALGDISPPVLPPDDSLAERPVVLEVTGLSVDYGTGERALHAVDSVGLRLHRGEVLGIAGESGSGKSTLAYAMNRLLRAPGIITGGSVRYHPKQGGAPIDIMGLSEDELRRLHWDEVAMVFQSSMNALNPVLTLRAQISDVLRAHRPSMTRDEQRARVYELLRLVGISPDRATAFPHELSGGMRQRAMIAMALALDPEIIIMDEPTTALDVVMQRQILGEILRLRDKLGFSVIFITHDLSMLIEMADTIAVMYAGRVVETSPSTGLYRAPRHPYSAGLLSSFPLLHGPRKLLQGIPGSPPDLRAVPPGCPYHPRCPFAQELCSQREPRLVEDPYSTRPGTRRVSCLMYEPDGIGPPPARLRGGEPPAGDATAGVAIATGPLAEPWPLAEVGRGAEPGPLAEPLAEAVPPPRSERRDDDGTVPVLEAVEVVKHFRSHHLGRRGRGRGSAVRAVDGVSFALYAGEVTALVGESGSGKSTVARLLAGLYPPTRGWVWLGGRRVRPRRGGSFRRYARQVQLILQDPFSSLNPTHKVRYILSRPLRLHRKARAKDQTEAQLASLLGDVNLSPAAQFLDKFPHELSGGQSQRISLARALAAEPSVLLADEPVSMLDVSIRLGVLNLFQRLVAERRLALLYITHDIASARYFATTTLVMYAGQLVEGGPSEVVTQRPAHPYTRLLIASAPDPDRLDRGAPADDRGEPPSLMSPPSGCRFHPRCPHAMPVCRERFPPRSELPDGQWAHCWLYSAPEPVTMGPARRAPEPTSAAN